MDYSERQQLMLEYQEKNKVPPTMRKLAELWEVDSTSTVSHSLRKMERQGMVEKHKRGEKYSTYVAVQGVQNG